MPPRLEPVANQLPAPSYSPQTRAIPAREEPNRLPKAWVDNPEAPSESAEASHKKCLPPRPIREQQSLPTQAAHPPKIGSPPSAEACEITGAGWQVLPWSLSERNSF